MYLLYSVSLLFGICLALPYLMFRRLRRRGHLLNLRQRLWTLPFNANGEREATTWIHAVSVGEVLAVDPLLKLLRTKLPGAKFYLSTVTATGQSLASKRGDVEAAFYFPLDLRPIVRRRLEHINPQLFIAVETEIWPNFLRECKRRRVKTALVNGRISDRSFWRYQLVRGFIGRVLADMDLFCMQGELDAERIIALGAPPDRVHVTGNLKYDLAMDPSSDRSKLCDMLAAALDGSRVIIVAGSTVDGEEHMLIDAFKSLKSRYPALKLIIAPRRPERFDQVAALLSRSDVRWARRSWFVDDASGLVRGGRPTDVILLDSIGELRQIYRLATIVFVGGSLASPAAGGHNIIEPACYGKPILFGPHMSNFRDIAKAFLGDKAAIQVLDRGDLLRWFERLIEDEDLRFNLGSRALRTIERNRGAADRTVNLLLKLAES